MVSFSCNMVLMIIRYSNFTIRSLVDSSVSRIHASFVLILLDAPLPQFFIILQGIARATRCFQLLTSILNGFFELLVSSGSDEIDPSQFSCILHDGAFHATTFAYPSAGRASSIVFQSSGHGRSGLEVCCFLVNLHPDHIYPSGGFSSNRVKCVKPVQGSDKSLDPSIFQ